MVDNENQWENMEYSDDEAGEFEDEYVSDDDVADEEYSEQDYEDYEEGYDDEEGMETAPKKGGAGGCIVLLLLLLLLVGAAVFFFFGKKGGGDENQSQPQQAAVENSQMQSSNDENQNPSDTTALGDSFFSEAGGSDMMAVDLNSPENSPVQTNEGNEEIVAAVTEVPQEEAQQPEQPQEAEVAQGEESNIEDLFPQDGGVAATEENSEIMVAYNRKARVNPFKPPVLEGKVDGYDTVGDGEFEIIEPPVTSVADENLTRLLQTQISGILYDEASPSAIVNLNGIDQFVKIGDVIAGYTIDSITRDKVQITYKNNTYVASVGELFTRGLLERQQAVADLENKFAGRYRNE